MWKILKVNDTVSVVFPTGECYQRVLNKEEFADLKKAEKRDEIISIMNPEYKQQLEEYKECVKILKDVEKSTILSRVDNVVIWNEVSKHSLPVELIKSIVRAEKKNDTEKLTAYKNFWTLMSLNPDEQCRKNLYKFLVTHGIVIEKHGFFVAYRNVDATSEPGVFTDHHSHTFKIKIGEIVTMPRNECDSSNDVECSFGLHLAGMNWLDQNYFGNVGLVCLCNPADVVAVPSRSDYGKLRCCAYLPFDKLDYSGGKPVHKFNEDGFDCSLVSKVIYEGLQDEREETSYKIEIPILSIGKYSEYEKHKENLYKIALQAIKERNK